MTEIAWAAGLFDGEGTIFACIERAEQFVHRKLVPLDQADLSSSEDRGQINMFGNECDGMCGT